MVYNISRKDVQFWAILDTSNLEYMSSHLTSRGFIKITRMDACGILKIVRETPEYKIERL
jgi:hypothetical protein